MNKNIIQIKELIKEEFIEEAPVEETVEDLRKEIEKLKEINVAITFKLVNSNVRLLQLEEVIEKMEEIKIHD